VKRRQILLSDSLEENGEWVTSALITGDKVEGSVPAVFAQHALRLAIMRERPTNQKKQTSYLVKPSLRYIAIGNLRTIGGRARSESIVLLLRHWPATHRQGGN